MWAGMMMGPGGMVYGGSGMAAILQGEGIPPETIEALLSSAAPPACLNGQGPGPMMNFEGAGAVRGSTTPDRPLLPRPAYPPPPPLVMLADSDLDDLGFLRPHHLHPPSGPPDPKKRRLSSEQVQFLERSFEAENKLEPERKAELAHSLGLQPRQVAIWFQNRRARWKTKQLEREFEAVREGYEGLKREYEAARKDKEKLEAEVNYLREQLLHRQRRRRSEAGEVQHQGRPCVITQGGEMNPTPSSKAGAAALREQDEAPRLPLHEEPVETDQSELSHAEEDEDLQGAAAAAAGCRYEFPAGLDEHIPVWLWHPAEFCGP